MKRLFSWLVTGFVLVVMGSYGSTHWRQIANAVATPAGPQGETEKTYEEVREAQSVVGIAGPLANHVAHQEQPKVETARGTTHQATALDHVEGSVVGTSSAILHSTFAVKSIVNLPFEVPAHAANPQLRGTYRSFAKRAGSKGETEPSEVANVEFLVLNEEQYADFLQGHDSEVIFSAEDAHDQEVNTGLPPTITQPAKYYLVFRNSAHETGEKLVQADFHLDF
jgi:hypothetical protein